MILGIVVGMARKKTKRKGRASEQSIDGRGREIYEKGDQITPLNDQRWDVASQSVSYMMSLGCGKATCDCSYHVKGKAGASA